MYSYFIFFFYFYFIIIIFFNILFILRHLWSYIFFLTLTCDSLFNSCPTMCRLNRRHFDLTCEFPAMTCHNVCCATLLFSVSLYLLQNSGAVEELIYWQRSALIRTLGTHLVMFLSLYLDYWSNFFNDIQWEKAWKICDKYCINNKVNECVRNIQKGYW